MKILILFAVLVSTAYADLANEIYQHKLDQRAANLKIVKDCLANPAAHPEADCDKAIDFEYLAQKEDDAERAARAEADKKWFRDLDNMMNPPATASDIERALSNDRLKDSLGQY